MFSENKRGDKKDQGKLKFSLLPIRALKELVKNYTQGAVVHGVRNWENGFEWTRCADAIQRHFWDWMDGEDFDNTGPDASGIHHMACIAFWAMALVEFFYTHPELDDRPRVIISKEHLATIEKIKSLSKIVPDYLSDCKITLDEGQELRDE